VTTHRQRACFNALYDIAGVGMLPLGIADYWAQPEELSWTIKGTNARILTVRFEGENPRPMTWELWSCPRRVSDHRKWQGLVTFANMRYAVEAFRSGDFSKMGRVLP